MFFLCQEALVIINQDISIMQGIIKTSKRKTHRWCQRSVKNSPTGLWWEKSSNSNNHLIQLSHTHTVSRRRRPHRVLILRKEDKDNSWQSLSKIVYDWKTLPSKISHWFLLFNLDGKVRIWCNHMKLRPQPVWHRQPCHVQSHLNHLLSSFCFSTVHV